MRTTRKIGKGNTLNRTLKAIAITMLMMVTTIPLSAVTIIGNQNQQSGNPNNLASEGSSTTATYWARTYGGAGGEYAYSVQQTADGGYIVAGSTGSFGPYSSGAWILKLNSTGGVTWEKTYGSNAARSIQQTADGGYIVAGISQVGAGVSKLNSTGGVTWKKTYAGGGGDAAYSVQQTTDGGYIVAGNTNSFPIAVNAHMWVLKLDSTGGVTWQKMYNGSDFDTARSVSQTADGGYIVAGYTRSFGAGEADAWVLKLDSTGGVTWQKTYGGTKDDYASFVQQTSDGGYIVAGTTGSFGGGYYLVWVLKLDSTGGVTWQKTYNGSGFDTVRSVSQTADGGYIVAVGTSFGAGGTDFWVLKLDSTGGVTWQKTYGGTKDDYPYSVQQTADGGYIVAGNTWSFSAGYTDIWVVKLGVGGDIVFSGGSGASNGTTSDTPSDTTATTLPTSVVPVNTTATATDEGVTPQATSATVMIQSPDTIPPATITDLAIGTAENTSITLTWTAPGDDAMKGIAKGYVVKYSTTGRITSANWTSASTYTQSWTPANNGTLETHAVTELLPGTKYWFAVEAYDKASNYGGISNSPSGTTTAPSGGGGTEQGIPVAVVLGVAAVVVALLAVVIMKKKKHS